MTIYIIRIEPEGSVSIVDGDDLLDAARSAFDGATSTFTCHPIVDGPPVFPNFEQFLVGVCHDFAYSVTPVCNPKAWALYGRSPIAGPAFFAHDIAPGGRTPLDPEWVATLGRDDWLVPGVMNVTHMQHLAADAGLAWPVMVAG